MENKKAFLAFRIPEVAFDVPDAFFKKLEQLAFYVPWLVEMIPDEGEEVTFSGILGPCDFVAGTTEYAYTRDSGYESVTWLTPKEGWKENDLNADVLATYAHQGFLVSPELSIKDLCRKLGIELPAIPGQTAAEWVDPRAIPE